MGNRDIERLIRKIIKEAPVDYGDYPERMDPKIQRRIEDPEGLYAKNRAFKGGVSDVEKLTGKRFKEVVDYVKRYFGTEQNVTSPQVKMAIQLQQMRAISQAMQLEPRYKEQLRDLAVEIAAKEEGWLPYSDNMEQSVEKGLVVKKRKDGGVVYEFDFVNMLTFLGEKRIDPSIFKMKPEKEQKLPLPPNFSFDIDELTPEEQKQLEIEKRNVINALIQGKGKRGQFSYQMYKDRLDAIDPGLYPLYNKILGANDLMYFTDEDLIEALGGNAAGAAGKMPEPNSDEDEDDDEGGEEEEGNDTYFANGLIFPLLLHELFKAFSMVQARAQWKDMDPEMATQVIGQTDTMQNEPMNFRVGGELVRKLRTLLPDELTLDNEGKKYIPFFEQLLYSIPAEQFLKDVIANVISDNKSDNEKAQRKFNELLQQAKANYKKYKEGDDDDDDYEDDEEDDDILTRLGL
jgi:hypothetical protein